MGKAQEDGTKNTHGACSYLSERCGGSQPRGGVSKASSGRAPGTPSGGD